MIDRYIFPETETKSSIILLGTRKAGKSTYLNERYPNSTYADLLDPDTYDKYKSKRSAFLNEIETLKKTNKLIEPVIIDEIQKIPELLDSVHLLIEKYKIKFILCGSSARKLYRAGVNMLGGRAIGKRCFPLTYYEIVNSDIPFDLLKAMQQGLIPDHYLNDTEYKHIIRTYVREYIDLEIKAEGLVRNVDSFYKFVNSIGFCNTDLMNYSNIARDCGVTAKTVKTYYDILCETFMGSYIYPFKNSNKRQTISSTPKFYLFDIGIANHLSKDNIESLDSSAAGKLFEHFIYLELLAYNEYKDRFADFYFWRTKHDIEVDFIISQYKKVKVAIECKLSKNIRSRDLKSIEAFAEENDAEKLILVSLDTSFIIKQTKNGKDVYLMPYDMFLKDLWSGEFF